jgi:hypothetical protein
MQIQTKEEHDRLYYLDADGCWIEERLVCHRCLDQGIVRWADERYSFGCYAGKWCDECWPKSGYRDATDTGAVFDEMDAGERIEADY